MCMNSLPLQYSSTELCITSSVPRPINVQGHTKNCFKSGTREGNAFWKVDTSDKECGYPWPGSVPWQGNMSFYASSSWLNTALFFQAVLDENSAILCLAVYKEQRGFLKSFC